MRPGVATELDMSTSGFDAADFEIALMYAPSISIVAFCTAESELTAHEHLNVHFFI